MKKCKQMFLLMAVSTACLSACGAKTETQTPNQTEQIETKEEIKEETKEEKKESSETKEEKQEAKKQADANIQVYLENLYLDQYNEETYEEQIDIKYQKISLDEKNAARYPNLVKALNQHNQEIENLANENYTQMQANLEEMLSDVEDENPPIQSYHNTYDIYRCDQTVFSARSHLSEYWGGVHGYDGINGINYDTESGALLKLTDVVKNMDGFSDLVFEKLVKQYPYLEFDDKKDMIVDLIKDPETISWVISNKGVTLYFNPYAISYYAAGMQVAEVDFSENPQLFHEKYLQTASKSWILPVELLEQVYVDLDGNGTPDSVEIRAGYSEYDSIHEWQFFVNDVETDFEAEAYSGRPYIVKTENHCYVYLFYVVDNDGVLLEIYDLSNGVPNKISELCLGDSCWNGVSNSVLTDPNHLKLEHRCDCLSTMMTYKYYSVGEDGIPVTEDPWYTVGVPRELTLKKPMKFDIVDENGNVTSSRMLEAGTICKMYRTDEETFFDFLIDQGEIGRVNIEREEWSHKVNGESAEDVFDNMMFAG